MSTQTAPVTPSPWPVAKVRTAAGISVPQMEKAFRQDLVSAIGTARPGPMGRPARLISNDDALFLIAAAAFAVAAGMAFLAMLKALRSAGAQLDPATATLVIPVTSAALLVGAAA